MNVNFKKLFMTGFLSLSLLGGVLISTNNNAAIEANAVKSGSEELGQSSLWTGDIFESYGSSVHKAWSWKETSTATASLPNLSTLYDTGAISLNSKIQIKLKAGTNGLGTATSELLKFNFLSEADAVLASTFMVPTSQYSSASFDEVVAEVALTSSDEVVRIEMIYTDRSPAHGITFQDIDLVYTMEEASFAAVESISIIDSDLTMYEGTTMQMNTTVLPAEANQNVTWAVLSDPEGCATIDANGLLAAVSPGTVIVEATSVGDASKSDSTEIITILEDVITDFTYSGTPVSQVGGTLFNSEGLTFTATYTGKGAISVDHADIAFAPSVLSSSDTSVTASYDGLTVEITDVTVVNEIALLPSHFESGYTSTEKVINNVVEFGYTNMAIYNNQIGFNRTGVAALYNKQGLTNVVISITDADHVNLEIMEGTSMDDLTSTVTNNSGIFTLNPTSTHFSITNSTTGFVNIDDDGIKIRYTEVLNPVNDLVEYIMAEDVEDQCNTRFPEAKTMFLALSVDDQNTFRTSTETDIVAARERYVAWAAHLNQNPWAEGEALNTITSNAMNSMNAVIIIISLSLASVSVIGGYYFVQKKQKQD